MREITYYANAFGLLDHLEMACSKDQKDDILSIIKSLNEINVLNK